MRSEEGTTLAEWTQPEALESPFAEGEAASSSSNGQAQPLSWSEALSPFADFERDELSNETDTLLAEALSELRDETFHEAVAFLAEETEQAVSDRFDGEAALYGEQQERFADAHLSNIRFQAEQYLGALRTGLSSQDAAALDSDKLDEVLDGFDPQPGDLTPAGEEFIGKLVKKAKKAVRFVVDKAKQVGKLAMPFLGPLLNQLRKLIGPLLRRVLSMAIGRLPAPLQPAARTLSTRFLGEGEADGEEPEMAPATRLDPEALTDSFDYRLAEALAYPEALSEAESEAFGGNHEETLHESRELEALAEARGALIDSLGEGDGETVAPAIEQFAPVLLGVLRTGIRLVGRPRVVGFLAKYLAQLIGQWVGKDVAAPLSRAIVDTGLRMATLEAEREEHEASGAAPVALASVIEDALRRFAENEDYVLDNEDLSQVALADAFGAAVATHFPQDQVREELQLAPSLGGAFVTRRPRAIRSYAKYSRTPEIEISSRLADTLPAFGGTSLGAATRAAGGRFPVRARMHIYQLRPGSTVGSMLRHDRRLGAAAVHPLTPRAAGMLLREPSLGAAVPKRYLRSRHRLAAGQRVYVLETVGGIGVAPPGSSARIAPSRVWLTVNPAMARVVVGFYLSEAEAQEVAAALRAGRGSAPLLSRLFAGLKRFAGPEREEAGEDFAAPAGEEGEDFAGFAAARGLSGAARLGLRRRIAAWALPAIAAWLRDHADAFTRAAAHPDPGVTLRVRLSDVPGLAALGRSGVRTTLRGRPAVTVSVSPGRRR